MAIVVLHLVIREIWNTSGRLCGEEDGGEE